MTTAAARPEPGAPRDPSAADAAGDGFGGFAKRLAWRVAALAALAGASLLID